MEQVTPIMFHTSLGGATADNKHLYVIESISVLLISVF